LIKKLGLNLEDILKHNIFDIQTGNSTIKDEISNSFNGKKQTIFTEMFNTKLKIELHPQYKDKEVAYIIAIATLDGDDKHEEN